MKTLLTGVLVAMLLWATPTWAQAVQPTVGPVNCLFSWDPVTQYVGNAPIPAGTIIIYRLYIQPVLTPAPVTGTTTPTWMSPGTAGEAKADCNQQGWTTTMASLAQKGTPPGQLYAWVTASVQGGAESALSLPFPFMWLLAAPPPPSIPSAPTGLTVK